jgi:hypothetical protein
MTTRSQAPTMRAQRCETGQRLYCIHCGSVIEIIDPGNVQSVPQRFVCCNREMCPTTEVSVHIGDDAS